MALTATLNKTTYTVGETMTLTVTTTAGDRDQFTDHPGTVTVDPDGTAGPIQPVTVDYVAKSKDTLPVPVIVTDPERTWTKQSDNGLVAVFTTVA